MGDDTRNPSLNVHSTPQRDELRRIVAEVVAAELAAERERREARIAEIMAGADRQPSFSQAKPKRDRHGMHIVRGMPVLAAGMVVNWLLRSRWHRRLATSALIAAVGTGAALSPDLMAPAPAAQAPVHHHAVRHHHGTDPAAVPVAPDRRKRRRRPAATAHGSAPPQPARSAGPSPSPAATPDPDPGVTPLPVPSVTVSPPVPLPTPTCLPLHGHHCHGGDILNPLEGVPGKALRGLTGSL